MIKLIAGLIALVLLMFVDSFAIIVATSIFCSIIAFYLVKESYFELSVHSNRIKWEMFFIPFSFTILNVLFFKNAKWVVASSMLVLILANFFETIIGRILPLKKYKITSDEKTIGGSIIFFIVTSLVILSLSTNIFNDYFDADIHFNTYLILSAILISAILTIFEAISSYGSDHFTIPVFGGLLLYVFLYNPNIELLYNFFIGSSIALIIVILSYYVKFLTLSGSTATFLLASFIFGFGGLKWSIPIMAFFILSSVLSKIRKKVNNDVETYFEKSGVRDHWQVVANGGIGGILVILNLIFPSELFYYMYVSSLAAVCADTWATEIGTMYRTKTYNILTFKLIDQGVSGGISLIGTLGGISGAMIIAFSGLYWIEINSIYFVLFIIISGIVGSFFDSVLGATIQAQFECGICGKLTEKEFHCNKITKHTKGINWLNNDFVNLLAGIGGGIFILLFKGLLS